MNRNGESCSGVKTVVTGLTVLKVFNVKFKVGVEWQGRELHFSLSISACALEHCLPEVPLMKNLRVEPTGRRKRSTRGEK